jgi:Icc-related predicted phosphoesterase
VRVLAVADVHGAHRRLAKMLRPDDVLLSLGDHVNVLDYKDLSGLLSQFVTKDAIADTLAAIQAGDRQAARLRMAQAAGSVPQLFEKVREAAVATYRDIAAALPCRAYIIYGNVDFPEAMAAAFGGPLRLCIAETVEIVGRRFGLVSGHPPGPFSFGMPGEVSKAEFAQRLHALGAIDALCVHSPPNIADLTYDVEADRDEEGSPDTLYYAELYRPRLVLFGHVHQPRRSEHVDGADPDAPIRYLNLSCFRDTGRALQIDPQTWETTWLTAD